MMLKVVRKGMGGYFCVECKSYIFKDDELTTFDSNDAVFFEMNGVEQLEVFNREDILH